MRRPHARHRLKTNQKSTRKLSNRHYKKKPKPEFLKFLESEASTGELWNSKETLLKNYSHCGMHARVNGLSGGCMSGDNKEIDFELNTEEWNDLDGGFIDSNDQLIGKQRIIFKGVKSGSKAVTVIEEVQLKEPENITETPTSENEIMTAFQKYIDSHQSVNVKVPSAGQLQFLISCFEKYQLDYQKMSRDLKLNPMQWTPKQIQKKFEKSLHLLELQQQ